MLGMMRHSHNGIPGPPQEPYRLQPGEGIAIVFLLIMSVVGLGAFVWKVVTSSDDAAVTCIGRVTQIERRTYPKQACDDKGCRSVVRHLTTVTLENGRTCHLDHCVYGDYAKGASIKEPLRMSHI